MGVRDTATGGITLSLNLHFFLLNSLLVRILFISFTVVLRVLAKK